LFDTPIEEVYDGVLTGKVLGTGVSGTVRMITHRVTGINYAVKCLDLSLINTPESLKRLREEINIMCHLDHPSVMRIEEVYESDNEIYLVQEICSGGDLFDRLNAQPNYRFTEAQSAKLVKQVCHQFVFWLSGLCFMNVHDLTPLMFLFRCWRRLDIFIPKE
jgi:calcium-dependent protein kinase